MGRQARIKRERWHARAYAPAPAAETTDDPRTQPSRTHVLTVPLPGFEGQGGEDGHFDDCPICQALRAGDEAKANELIRTHPNRIDGRLVHELDLAPFLAWLEEAGIDLESRN